MLKTMVLSCKLISNKIFKAYLLTKYSYSSILIGGLIIILSVFLASTMTNPTYFFLIYSIGFGTGKGFLYPTALQVGWSQLPGRKGMVSGLVVSGVGIGAFVFGLFTTYLVNPNNEQSTKI